MQWAFDAKAVHWSRSEILVSDLADIDRLNFEENTGCCVLQNSALNSVLYLLIICYFVIICIIC